jgi:WD40 repeat protein
MRLLIVKLLYPTNEDLAPSSGGGAANTPQFPPVLASPPTDPAAAATAAQQARNALARQDLEISAIRIQCNTLSPQSTYSTPALAWRPDGSGIWVNSDDGVVRGIEVSTGKVVATLRGHEPGSKIRCLSAASVCLALGKGDAEEWVISGGFDQKLIIWKTAP